MIRLWSTTLAAAWLFLACAGPAQVPAASTFEAQWQDGRAELDGYRYRVTRYGEPRVGQAVMIFVTEPFSESKRVKADDPAKDPADTFEALKLNIVRDFQTGIYDYNTMTSVFTRSRDFAPVKVSFTSAEWCGNVYEELRVDPARIDQSLRSYFEDESADRSLPAPAGGVLEENLFILLRGLRGPFLKPGETRTAPFLPAAFARRLAHRTLAWSEARVERLARGERRAVPAGSFDADVYVVRTADGREGRFWIERAAPHRIVAWSWSATGGDRGPGDASEAGELTGSARLPYWRLHGNGDERYLKTLGLRPGGAPGGSGTSGR